MSFLWERTLVWIREGLMLTLVQIQIVQYLVRRNRLTGRGLPRVRPSTNLAARNIMKAFGGMAILVLLGGAFGRVPSSEARMVAGLLVLPPLLLAAIEAIRWHRLVRRLDQLRAEVQTVRKS